MYFVLFLQSRRTSFMVFVVKSGFHFSFSDFTAFSFIAAGALPRFAARASNISAFITLEM